MNMVLIGNNVLRSAIRENLVSFPAQIPTLTKWGGVEERIVQLYFIRGWELRNIGHRFGLCKSTVRKIITDWKVRAISAGHIQEVYPEALAALVSGPALADETQDSDAGIEWDTVLPSLPAVGAPRGVAYLVQDQWLQSPRPGTASAP
jgi:hypothetical protein